MVVVLVWVLDSVLMLKLVAARVPLLAQELEVPVLEQCRD